VQLNVQRDLVVHFRIAGARVEARGEAAQPMGHGLS
jgi:hypothetical protein